MSDFEDLNDQQLMPHTRCQTTYATVAHYLRCAALRCAALRKRFTAGKHFTA